MKATYKGVVIESSSANDILKVIKKLQRSSNNEGMTKIPVKINPISPGRTYIRQGRKMTHCYWTAEEIKFVIENLDKSPSFVKKNFPTNRHTKNAINTMISTIKMKNYERISKDVLKLMKEYNII